MSRTPLGVAVASLAVVAATLAGTLAHLVVIALGPLTLPVGLLVAVSLLASTQAWAVAAWPAPAVAVGGVLGWAVATSAALSPGPGGDLLVAEPTRPLSLGWLVAGPLALLAATVLTRRRLAVPVAA